MNDTADGALNAEADALRGRFISRVADLERGVDANLYLFFGVDQDKEALFRSTFLANLGLAAKIGAIRHIVALYELKADPQIRIPPRSSRTVQSCTQRLGPRSPGEGATHA
jgi:hypothetical protein